MKELVLVDETAGIRVKDLRLRELPFLRADIPMYDVMKVRACVRVPSHPHVCALAA